MATKTKSLSGTELFAVSAGLDAVSGVFGYLASKSAQDMADSRARLVRLEADADAQRYAEKARAFGAQQKVEFLSSGVTLAGSPLDILDKQAQLAAEDIASIRRRGAIDALDQETAGSNAASQGRSLLSGGMSDAVSTLSKIWTIKGNG